MLGRHLAKRAAVTLKHLTAEDKGRMVEFVLYNVVQDAVLDAVTAGENVSDVAHIVLRWWRRSYGVVSGLRVGATGDLDHDHDRHYDRDDY